jgi:hypothetical protein
MIFLSPLLLLSRQRPFVFLTHSCIIVFLQLLEQQPFADADDSYFEEEEYGTVSALLGERAKPFLAIPFGPLQVGHFIGSLVFVLMAFIEYPGFPLTSLPSSVRGCFQGGTYILAKTYTMSVRTEGATT